MNIFYSMVNESFMTMIEYLSKNDCHLGQYARELVEVEWKRLFRK